MKKKIYVKAPALSQSGYGEQSRFALRALRSREDLFEIYIAPIPWGQTGWIWKDTEFRRWIDERIIDTAVQSQENNLNPDISLQITIPNEFENICPINIGYTAGIETNKVAPQWLEKGNEMDKILVVSNHSKTTYTDTKFKAKNNETGALVDYQLETPVEVVWETTPREEPEEIPGFDPEYNFNFLMVSQFGPRKNFTNAIKWWVEEFIDKKVGLIVKTNLRGNCKIDLQSTEEFLQNLLKPYEDRKCKVYLLHGDLTSGQMTSLYNNEKVKAIVNISHGEGFGLPLFEAAREGLPIISIAWSGQLDFLHHDGKDYFQKVKYSIRPVQQEAVWDGIIEKDSMWAFAEQGSYKMVLRKTHKKWKQAKKTAETLKSIVSKKFTEESLFNLFCEQVYFGKIPDYGEIDGVSFCIPTNHKRNKELELCIKSIQQQKGLPFEIIVCGDVDNIQKSKKINLIDEKDSAHNRKVATLRNRAAEKAKYNVICYLDDDIILTPNWMTRFIEFSRNKKWSVLSNKIINPDGSRYWDRATIRPHQIVDYDHSESDKDLYQSSCFFLVRKGVFDRVKWDETKLVYADREGQIPEDVQYSFDLIRSGYSLSFDKENLVWHNDNSYTVWNKGNEYRGHICLKKEIITEEFDVEFFPPNKREFKQIVDELENK